MTVTYKLNDTTYRVFSKGATEVLLENCKNLLKGSETIEMTPEKKR